MGCELWHRYASSRLPTMLILEDIVTYWERQQHQQHHHTSDHDAERQSRRQAPMSVKTFFGGARKPMAHGLQHAAIWGKSRFSSWSQIKCFAHAISLQGASATGCVDVAVLNMRFSGSQRSHHSQIIMFPYVSICFHMFPYVSICFHMFPYVSICFPHADYRSDLARWKGQITSGHPFQRCQRGRVVRPHSQEADVFVDAP